METTTFNIGGMTCMGCVASVTRVLKAAPGAGDTDARASACAVRRRTDQHGKTEIGR